MLVLKIKLLYLLLIFDMVTVIRRECGQTLARVRVSQAKIVSIIISLQ